MFEAEEVKKIPFVVVALFDEARNQPQPAVLPSGSGFTRRRPNKPGAKAASKQKPTSQQ